MENVFIRFSVKYKKSQKGEDIVKIRYTLSVISKTNIYISIFSILYMLLDQLFRTSTGISSWKLRKNIAYRCIFSNSLRDNKHRIWSRDSLLIIKMFQNVNDLI